MTTSRAEATIATAPADVHPRLLAWLQTTDERTQPAAIQWCDGSQEEYDRLCQQLVDAGTFTRLSDAKRPNSYLARSDPRDVARVEDRTFICATSQRHAGPTNNWRDPRPMRPMPTELFPGSMRGRTMYVVPFSMGPIGSDKSYIGVQLTDSPYVVVSMRIMSRMGRAALDALGYDGHFVPGVHSVGMPLTDGVKDVPWPCNPEHTYIAHFPNTRAIWSHGSGVRRQRAARQEVRGAADRLGHGEGRGLACGAHADPQAHLARGSREVHRRRVPVGLRQDEPGHADPDSRTLEGADHRRRHRLDEVRLRRPAVRDQPEAGFFGVAPGTGESTNPNAMQTIKRDAIVTNCALTDDGDVWWEGMTEQTPSHLVDFGAATTGQRTPSIPPRTPMPASGRGRPVPGDRPRVGGPRRRADRRDPVRRPARHMAPLVREAFDWTHGVFLGASMSSEKTAAASGTIGERNHLTASAEILQQTPALPHLWPVWLSAIWSSSSRSVDGYLP